MMMIQKYLFFVYTAAKTTDATPTVVIIRAKIFLRVPILPPTDDDDVVPSLIDAIISVSVLSVLIIHGLLLSVVVTFSETATIVSVSSSSSVVVDAEEELLGAPSAVVGFVVVLFVFATASPFTAVVLSLSLLLVSPLMDIIP